MATPIGHPRRCALGQFLGKSGAILRLRAAESGAVGGVRKWFGSKSAYFIVLYQEMPEPVIAI
ncbi:hypothetical protein [Nitrosomonas aestuarii]|uniref:hypothetical protein n=1 Tax=Nitrosomonas aestuarii TaxID=52441 RepID=UPI000B8144E5|nr:hypothetical protein [Nitrosomonas aestuarii]